MTPPLAWVVGRRGLLGSSVERALGEHVWRPDRAFAWSEPHSFEIDVREAVRGFGTRIAAEPGRSWTLCWCAGAGVIGTSASALSGETAALSFFLEQLAAEPQLAAESGSVLLASSAGGIHGGSRERPLSEASPPAPISDYGRAKLEQEHTLATWASQRPRVSTLVARFTNLYGPGQRLDKPQGLISHISQCLILGRPVHIYVPLDTIRDYLFAEDAGQRVRAGILRLAQESATGGRHITKIYGSEREVSVASLIGVFRQIAKRRLRMISGLHALRSQQPVQLQFRSQVWAEEGVGSSTTLLEGITRVHRHCLLLFQAGQLPSPATR